VTTFDAQQLASPFGPQVAAKPTHEGGGPQTFVAALQLGVAPPQSESERHPTHCEVVPKSLHLGVPPAHLAQAAPQLESALHSEHTPAPAHNLFAPHATFIGA